jgi:hypothetical protein
MFLVLDSMDSEGSSRLSTLVGNDGLRATG